MIEHFEKFDLLPLSFSHLNEFAFYRERWALRRIFGYEFPTSASAVRGQSVESGINMFLNGIPLEEATEKMVAEYDANCSTINDPKIEDERNNLVPLLQLGTKEFQKYAYSWNLLTYQKKVELYSCNYDPSFIDKKTSPGVYYMQTDGPFKNQRAHFVFLQTNQGFTSFVAGCEFINCSKFKNDMIKITNSRSE